MAKLPIPKDDPIHYELIGGPFDGSSLRLAKDLFERPPKSIVIGSDSDDTRGSCQNRYIYDVRHTYDADGHPIDYTEGYFCEVTTSESS